MRRLFQEKNEREVLGNADAPLRPQHHRHKVAFQSRVEAGLPEDNIEPERGDQEQDVRDGVGHSTRIVLQLRRQCLGKRYFLFHERIILLILSDFIARSS